ncbi:hypothetical protein [Geminocystis sp. GBBB08]|uniref:hypothetical protein n=1 Tax=Geminocystis sp. GBBB08 TaxID=2604140 RepID=UPI0027E36FC8|nr:hypothetical protein [Geminocystis sp. GBBB08]MBL1209802.1 hypothetical protein [Geminocystis sp. GBBB08]
MKLSKFVTTLAFTLFQIISFPLDNQKEVLAQSSERRVNPSNPCPHGGRVAGVNCKIYAFENPVIVVPEVKYWVSVDYAGVYYKPVEKICPYGGGRVGANCKLVSLDGLLTKGIEYWVDTNINYPGVYYRQSK